MPKVKREKKWYAIAVETNMEGRIRKEVKRQAKIEGLDKKIGKLISPVEKIEEKRNTETGTKTVTKYEKKLPGYLVAYLDFTDDVFHLIKATKGVFGFLPLDAPRPTEIEGPEIQYLLALDKATSEAPAIKKVVLNFKVGDRVEVVRGNWKGTEGVVKSISGTEAEPLVTVTMTVWGRNTDLPNIVHNHLKRM